MDSANYLDRSGTIPLFATSSPPAYFEGSEDDPSSGLRPLRTRIALPLHPPVSFVSIEAGKVGRRIPRPDRGNPSGVPWLN